MQCESGYEQGGPQFTANASSNIAAAPPQPSEPSTPTQYIISNELSHSNMISSSSVQSPPTPHQYLLQKCEGGTQLIRKQNRLSGDTDRSSIPTVALDSILSSNSQATYDETEPTQMQCDDSCYLRTESKVSSRQTDTKSTSNADTCSVPIHSRISLVKSSPPKHYSVAIQSRDSTTFRQPLVPTKQPQVTGPMQEKQRRQDSPTRSDCSDGNVSVISVFSNHATKLKNKLSMFKTHSYKSEQPPGPGSNRQPAMTARQCGASWKLPPRYRTMKQSNSVTLADMHKRSTKPFGVKSCSGVEQMRPQEQVRPQTARYPISAPPASDKSVANAANNSVVYCMEQQSAPCANAFSSTTADTHKNVNSYNASITASQKEPWSFASHPSPRHEMTTPRQQQNRPTNMRTTHTESLQADDTQHGTDSDRPRTGTKCKRLEHLDVHRCAQRSARLGNSNTVVQRRSLMLQRQSQLSNGGVYGGQGKEVARRSSIQLTPSGSVWDNVQQAVQDAVQQAVHGVVSEIDEEDVQQAGLATEPVVSSGTQQYARAALNAKAGQSGLANDRVNSAQRDGVEKDNSQLITVQIFKDLISLIDKSGVTVGVLLAFLPMMLTMMFLLQVPPHLDKWFSV